MGGKRFTNLKKISIFGVLIIAFFVLHQQAYAFGHPDRTAPSLIFKSPAEGQAINPDIENPSNPGFKVTYEAKDTTLNDVGGNVTECALYTKNSDDGWREQGPVKCSEAFIIKDWCNVEGTNTCGVRIRAADAGSRITQQERFFTIDYTPPRIEIGSNRSDPTQKTDATFRFSGSDAYGVGRVECALDEQPFSVCESPKEYKNIFPDGRHIFRVRAYDKARNSAEKSLEWKIDSTPPTLIPNLLLSNPTYFSKDLAWSAPEEYDAINKKNIASAQYDIRYSTTPITEKNWNEATAIIYQEPSAPKPPGGVEAMRIGPESDREKGFLNLKLGDLSNILSANIKHYFAIKTRDQNWNWSRLSNIPAIWTKRDPCDYDADRLYSPKSGCGPRVCNPNLQSCDLYDNPFEWALPGDWPFDKPDDVWIKTFGATTHDLDLDGEDVADGRIGINLNTKKEVIGHPKQTGTDWYDNSFTQDFLGLSVKPTLAQLKNTINDFDLDTFVSRDWKEKFAKDAPSEPVEGAELKISSGENISGCIYPGARESTCFDCTAYDPDKSTGRVPPGKTKPTTDKTRAVCQIEAYYADLPTGNYEVINQGTTDKKRPTIAASAQCRDGLNNDLLSGTDSSEDPRDPNREINCPTKFEINKNTSPSSELTPSASPLQAGIFPDVGIVQCGRHADDYRTPIDESANCNICHFFYLVFSITNLVVSRLMPLIVALSIVAGGLLILTSRGSVERFTRGRKVIIWAISAYAAILFAWMLLSIFFVLIGVTKWTGLTPERGDITGLSETTISDTSKNWGDDVWKSYFVEIRPREGEPVAAKIVSSTKDTLTLSEGRSFKIGDSYRILNTGWWSFVCELGEGAIADFSASPDSGIAPFEVDFTDLSIGDITSWSWDFGDGARSAEQSPRHQYTTNGPHTVVLTVAGKYDTGRKTKIIHYAPTAEFSAPKTHGRVPFTTQFEDKSTGEIEKWSWDLNGDENEDTQEKNPSYTYEKPGPYRINITVSGPGGRDTESKLSYIFVYPSALPPRASFSTSTIPGTLTLTTTNLSFDTSPHPSNDHITGWEWDFGDGRGTSGVLNPTYFYETNTEPYTLTLKAIGPGGENSTSTTVAFPPEANFSADKTSGVLPKSGPFNIKFADNSTGTVNGWGWNFGDGGVSNLQNPSYNYATNGLYTVRLQARGPEGEDEKIIEKYISIAPRAVFSYSSVALTDPTPQGANDCTSSLGCTVGASGASVTFVNNSRCPSGGCTWYWEFGDGDTSTEQAPRHVYKNNEIYTARLTVTGPGGSNSSEIQNYIRVSPYAGLSANPTDVTLPCGSTEPDPCPPASPVTVTFQDSSSVDITDLLLRFGDGSSETIQKGSSVTHSYGLGNYTAMLQATDHNGLTNNESVNISIRQEPPIPPPPPEEPEPAEPESAQGLDLAQWISNIIPFLMEKAGFTIQEALNFIEPYIPF